MHLCCYLSMCVYYVESNKTYLLGSCKTNGGNVTRTDGMNGFDEMSAEQSGWTDTLAGLRPSSSGRRWSAGLLTQNDISWSVERASKHAKLPTRWIMRVTSATDGLIWRHRRRHPHLYQSSMVLQHLSTCYLSATDIIIIIFIINLIIIVMFL